MNNTQKNNKAGVEHQVVNAFVSAEVALFTSSVGVWMEMIFKNWWQNGNDQRVPCKTCTKERKKKEKKRRKREEKEEKWSCEEERKPIYYWASDRSRCPRDNHSDWHIVRMVVMLVHKRVLRKKKQWAVVHSTEWELHRKLSAWLRPSAEERKWSRWVCWISKQQPNYSLRKHHRDNYTWNCRLCLDWYITTSIAHVVWSCETKYINERLDLC